jgi:hypothetical protein
MSKFWSIRWTNYIYFNAVCIYLSDNISLVLIHPFLRFKIFDLSYLFKYNIWSDNNAYIILTIFLTSIDIYYFIDTDVFKFYSRDNDSTILSISDNESFEFCYKYMTPL